MRTSRGRPPALCERSVVWWSRWASGRAARHPVRSGRRAGRRSPGTRTAPAWPSTRRMPARSVARGSRRASASRPAGTSGTAAPAPAGSRPCGQAGDSRPPVRGRRRSPTLGYPPRPISRRTPSTVSRWTQLRVPVSLTNKYNDGSGPVSSRSLQGLQLAAAVISRIGVPFSVTPMLPRNEPENGGTVRIGATTKTRV